MIADRYEQDGQVQAGGMAAVLFCTDTILERPVAIKIMPGVASRARIRDELNALLKMRSKHVVQVYDVLKMSEHDLAIVQEFVAGQDLLSDIHVPTTAAQYLKLIWQIASGIADIHSLNVIHRDIKPNNMKVDGEGVLKIFDFGLARDEGPEASTIGFVGTPGFAAPEQYEEPFVFTSAVDVYAFGATALYVAQRSLPKSLNRHPMPPQFEGVNYFKNLPFELPVEVAEILGICLLPSPDERPRMHEVRDVLSKHLLFDKHKALVVFNGAASYLDASRRLVSLTLLPLGAVTINYDGFCFTVVSVDGEVYVNNRLVAVGDALPGACVVALGGPEYKNRRRYITFDLSNPEIVL